MLLNTEYNTKILSYSPSLFVCVVVQLPDEAEFVDSHFEYQGLRDPG